MKNLLIYTGSQQAFGAEDATLIKIQIDNSLDLGWEREDIVLVTDFPYEYNGVKALVIENGIYYDFDLMASKTFVILYLLNQGLIEPATLYWCHDLDAFQNHPFTEDELGLEGVDLGLTHYTYKPEWQCGSLFFRREAKDIFELLDATTRAKPHLSRNNEKTLTKLIKQGAIDPKRYKRLDPTYNVMKRYLPLIYNQAIKPIRVLHFRPSDPKDDRMPDTALNMFMYGKNGLNTQLMSERLINIFRNHGTI